MKVGSIWEDSLADPVQALHAFRRILELANDNLVAIHAVQRVAERAGRHAQLVESLEREAELVDDRDRSWSGSCIARARCSTSTSTIRTPRCVRFRKALELDPAFVPALASVGRIYYRAGRWAELLETYEREVKVSKGAEAVALLHKMGELCEDKLGNADAAVEWYRRALELDPKYRPAIRALVRRCRESRDWAGLAGALEIEVAGLDDPSTRAGVWLRIGQVYEDWLGDPDKAIAAYRKALADRAEYRPARVAVARLAGQKREWMQLIDVLSQEAASTGDAIHATTVLMRQGEIYRDELDDPDLAIHCFEAVLQHEIGMIPALLALEPLYAKADAWDKLAQVYGDMGASSSDANARIAALRELVRLQATHELGTVEARARTYQKILEIDRDDESALDALEEIGRTTRDDRILVDVYRRLADLTDHPEHRCVLAHGSRPGARTPRRSTCTRCVSRRGEEGRRAVDGDPWARARRRPARQSARDGAGRATRSRAHAQAGDRREALRAVRASCAASR